MSSLSIFKKSLEPTELMLKLANETIDESNLRETDWDFIESEQDKYYDMENYEVMFFTYYGEPKAQARARVSSNFSHFYDPDQSIKQFVNEQIRNQLGNDFKPISKEIFFEAKYYRTMPKSFTARKRILGELGVLRPTVKPDLDNYEKLLYDS
uniref:RusA family crossover junction endodeoxyribonuclease n=1 Tax=Proteus mirabilis TaxID=584 RepID=UPI0034D40511